MKMKKAKDLTHEERMELYREICRASGIPIFNTKTVEIDDVGDFTQAVFDAQAEAEKQGGTQND